MQALFLVLHKVEKLDDLLAALQKSGINGGTIIESKGMLNTLKSNDNFIIESLRIFLEDPRETSKTLFFILKNEDVEKDVSKLENKFEQLMERKIKQFIQSGKKPLDNWFIKVKIEG